MFQFKVFQCCGCHIKCHIFSTPTLWGSEECNHAQQTFEPTYRDCSDMFTPPKVQLVKSQEPIVTKIRVLNVDMHICVLLQER